MGLLEETHFSKSTFFVLPWKAYHTEEQIQRFINALDAVSQSNSIAYLLPLPFTYLKKFSDSVKNSEIVIGATTMLNALPNSFTESIAAKILQQHHAQFVLIGTSESRQIYVETETSINHKIRKALEVDLTPFLCIGETLKELQDGKRTEVLARQLKEGLAGLSSQQLVKVGIIYEAPWLLKTHEKISVDKLTESYFDYRKILAEIVGIEVFKRMRLIDAIPNDIEDLSLLLKRIQGKGLYLTDPELLVSLVQEKHTLGIEIEQPENLPPIAEEMKEKIAVSQITEPVYVEERTALELEESLEETIEQSTDQNPLESSREHDEESFVESEQEVLGKEETASISSAEPLEHQPTLEFVEANSTGTPSEPEPEPEQKAQEPSTPKPKSASAQLKTDFLESEELASDSPAISNEQLQNSLEDIPGEAANGGTEKTELETRLEHFMTLDKELAVCYQAIRDKVELLPTLREQFPEKLNRMTVDLNQLDPFLQEQINRGNVAFFNENPEKAKEAAGVLIQLQELNALLH
ncbi:MAG: triose-phosphate isomerase, partial [Candidatus Bathyarchaeia archaeon]